MQVRPTFGFRGLASALRLHIELDPLRWQKKSRRGKSVSAVERSNV
jgi:hypothetical protein